MKKKTLVALAVCFLAAAMCLAADGFLGTWKLNEAKSKLPPGLPKNSTVVYTAAGDSVKVTIDGTDAAGKAIHNEWTGKYDGKDYPVTGSAGEDTRALKKVDDHKLELTVKKGGKVVITGTMELSPDGKTRTLNLNATDATGNKVSGTTVYDKQ